MSQLPFCLEKYSSVSRHTGSKPSLLRVKDLWQLANAADRHFYLGVMVNDIGSAPRRRRVKQADLCTHHANSVKGLGSADNHIVSGSLHNETRETPGPVTTYALWVEKRSTILTTLDGHHLQSSQYYLCKLRWHPYCKPKCGAVYEAPSDSF